MNSGQRLVVVDGVPETVQVLRAVFGPRGHQVDRVRAFELSQVGDQTDSVLVLHDDGGTASDGGVNQRVPRVIIGSLTAAARSEQASGDPHRLQQPFQYAELIRAVEALLVERPVADAA